MAVEDALLWILIQHGVQEAILPGRLPHLWKGKIERMWEVTASVHTPLPETGCGYYSTQDRGTQHLHILPGLTDRLGKNGSQSSQGKIISSSSHHQ